MSRFDRSDCSLNGWGLQRFGLNHPRCKPNYLLGFKDASVDKFPHRAFTQLKCLHGLLKREPAIAFRKRS